jgi:hypothetical protein
MEWCLVKHRDNFTFYRRIETRLHMLVRNLPRSFALFRTRHLHSLSFVLLSRSFALFRTRHFIRSLSYSVTFIRCLSYFVTFIRSLSYSYRVHSFSFVLLSPLFALFRTLFTFIRSLSYSYHVHSLSFVLLSPLFALFRTLSPSFALFRARMRRTNPTKLNVSPSVAVDSESI